MTFISTHVDMELELHGEESTYKVFGDVTLSKGSSDEPPSVFVDITDIATPEGHSVNKELYKNFLECYGSSMEQTLIDSVI